MEAAKCAPKTVQRPHPPFLIAGGGPQILELAALEADVLALVPLGTGAKTPSVEDVSFDTARAQLQRVREIAGARYERIELTMFADCVVN